MMKARVELSVSGILSRRGLGASGRLRKQLGQQVLRRCDKYVPYDTGRLKNTAVLSPEGGRITYAQPYAARQFYENYRHRDPNRGDHWHRRMLSREREALLAALRRSL